MNTGPPILQRPDQNIQHHHINTLTTVRVSDGLATTVRNLQARLEVSIDIHEAPVAYIVSYSRDQNEQRVRTYQCGSQ